MKQKAIVWSKPNCKFCNMAKNLLEFNLIEYQERVIDGEHWTREQLFEVVPNAKTVPQIFIKGKHIGGYEELVKYFEFSV